MRSDITIKDGPLTLTPSMLESRIEGLCGALAKLGVREGTLVAFLGHPRLEVVLLILALIRMKADCCPLNTYLPKQGIAECLDRLDSPLFVDPLSLEPASFLEKTTSHKTQFYLFTSGTTSKPKIAVLSFDNLLYSALGSNPLLGLISSDRYLLTLPLYHVSGLAILFRTLIAKATLVLSNKELEEELERFQITHLSCVPTQVQRLLKSEKPFSLKALLVGGAPISPALHQEAYEKKLPLFPSYGMTEMSSTITISPPQSSFSLGKVLPYRELMLAPDGEILVKGKTLFQGYYEKEKGIELPIDEKGWFHTRDRGDLCEGEITLLGRKDLMFISGGENIQPEEIEKVLCSLEGIQEAVVLPLPCPTFGERPIAFIRNTIEINKENLQKRLSTCLPKYKIPIDFFPLTHPVGSKPNRTELKKSIQLSGLIKPIFQ